MLEKKVEQHLRDSVRALGGWCLKLVCPGFTGVPDRMILLRGGVIAFAELKRPGQRERARQSYVQHRLRRMGFIVFSAVDSPAAVEGILHWCGRKVGGHDF